MPKSHEVTRLLLEWRRGGERALDELIPLVYEELRRLAHAHLVRERNRDVLQTTVLLHEAYLRLLDAREVDWHDRVHFFAIASTQMRRILVELARSRAGPRHGGGMRAVAIDEAGLAAADLGKDVVAINDALDELASLEPRQAKVVEMKFFGGMTEEEVADALKLSTDTVLRDWKKAKLWLWQELGRP